MPSKVYFIDFIPLKKTSLLEKLDLLLKPFSLDSLFPKDSLLAVKLHFGELGNMAYIQPTWVRKIVEILKSYSFKPFLTDTNTLYKGSRSDAVSHIKTAILNGFAYSVIGAPVIIADGLLGASYEYIQISLPYLKEFYIAKEIHQAHGLIVLTHFKGHELTGFGGTLKNLGMGCSARKGKLQQHSTISPQVNKKQCRGCGICRQFCPTGALKKRTTGKKTYLDPQKCIGCGECIAICPYGAIKVQWNEKAEIFMKKMVEYAYAVLSNKKGKSLFITFIQKVSPSCDCYRFNEYPIVRDIGILASEDPVAIDQAAVDLINKEASLPGAKIKSLPGEDKFKALYPSVEWTIQLEHAQKIGLGSRDYELITLP